MAQEDFVMSEVSLDGYKIVRGQYFSRLAEPNLSIWARSIQFNVPAYAALGNCEAVQILVHPVEKRIVVMPIASKDPDAIRWIKDPLNPKSYKMECSMFTRKLFENWGLDEKMRYRTNGKVALYDRKVILIYDFTHAEIWDRLKIVGEL